VVICVLTDLSLLSNKLSCILAWGSPWASINWLRYAPSPGNFKNTVVTKPTVRLLGAKLDNFDLLCTCDLHWLDCIWCLGPALALQLDLQASFIMPNASTGNSCSKCDWTFLSSERYAALCSASYSQGSDFASGLIGVIQSDTKRISQGDRTSLLEDSKRGRRTRGGAHVLHLVFLCFRAPFPNQSRPDTVSSARPITHVHWKCCFIPYLMQLELQRCNFLLAALLLSVSNSTACNQIWQCQIPLSKDGLIGWSSLPKRLAKTRRDSL